MKKQSLYSKQPKACTKPFNTAFKHLLILWNSQSTCQLVKVSPLVGSKMLAEKKHCTGCVGKKVCNKNKSLSQMTEYFIAESSTVIHSGYKIMLIICKTGKNWNTKSNFSNMLASIAAQSNTEIKLLTYWAMLQIARAVWLFKEATLCWAQLVLGWAVMLCGSGIKASMVRVWVAGKTAWSLCYHKPYLSTLEMSSS